MRDLGLKLCEFVRINHPREKKGSAWNGGGEKKQQPKIKKQKKKKKNIRGL
jgi:hypothetical protein